MHEVYSFNTIENFWRMFQNIYSVEEIMPNTDYMLFKKGISPSGKTPIIELEASGLSRSR